MVYRSLESSCEQHDLWQRVAEEVRPGIKATRTYRLALDACQQGLAAVTLQAERPAELITQLLGTKARVILNHRLDPQSHLGHYSVLLRFDGQQIEIHDPHHGPHRVLPWPEFAELWTPSARESEIVGGVLVAVGRASSDQETCSCCSQELPSQWTCPHCSKSIPAGPAGVLGCTAKGCRQCLWKRQFCLHCDWAVQPQ